ncbi:hypothetical protein HQ560_11995 [bacterium]|nr:hypothetical protein [bacterium]
MKHIALALLALAAVATGAAKTKTVDGVQVVGGAVLAATQPVTIKDVKLYQCTRLDTGAECTVVAGVVRLNHGCVASDLTITVRLWCIRDGMDYPVTTNLMERGTATTTVRCPAPHKDVRFSAIGPPVLPQVRREEHLRDGWRPAYSVSYEIHQHIPQ